MRHILLPTDFSDNALNAAKFAVELFQAEEATYHLLHAFSPYIIAPSGPLEANIIDDSLYNAAEEAANKKLEATKAQLLEIYPNALIETHAKFDFFLTSIEDFVENQPTNCIVLGTKGASGLKEITIGSNTSNLIGKVKTPIIAIPEDTVFDGIKNVVFSSDLEAVPSDKALSPLKRLLDLTDADLHLINIQKSPRDFTRSELDAKDAYKELLKDYKLTFEMVYDHSIENGINFYADNVKADMICMIVRKYSFLKRLLERSKSKSFTNHTDMPILVLNEENF